jgi:hypothetical protein
MIWLDAAQLGLANNDPVSEFTDFSGNARHFVQATTDNKPLFKSSGINGLGAVEGDGADDFMTLDAFGSQSSWWGFIVFRPITMGAAKELWSVVEYPATASEYKLLETDSGTTININHSPGPLTPSLIIANDRDYGFLLKGSPTANSILTNDGDTASKTGMSGTTPDFGSRTNFGMRLFNRGDGGLAFNVRIGELIFGEGTLSDPDQAQVWAYLDAKWDIGNPTVPPP